MQAVDRLLFAPPSAPGLIRSIGLAILAHALLFAALTWGVSWRRGEIVTAEAELWAALPQEAAPPPPEPMPEPAPAPPPPKAAPVVSDADIAIAREKQRKIEEQLAQEKLAEQKRLEQEKKAAEEKKRKELEAAKKEKLRAQEEAKQLEKQRQKNIDRITGLAGATGEPTAKGSALKSAGPSSSYGGRIRARIKPNIVFTEDIIGNPSAIVEVRTSPDGTIVGRKLLKSSKNNAWDEAVLKAIDKTEVLPRDIDGLVPPSLEITFRPRD